MVSIQSVLNRFLKCQGNMTSILCKVTHPCSTEKHNNVCNICMLIIMTNTGPTQNGGAAVSMVLWWRRGFGKCLLPILKSELVYSHLKHFFCFKVMVCGSPNLIGVCYSLVYLVRNLWKCVRWFACIWHFRDISLCTSENLMVKGLKYCLTY